MRPEVYSALVELCVDIYRRKGKRKLVWISDREKALSYEVKTDEMLLTVHRWFGCKLPLPRSVISADQFSTLSRSSDLLHSDH